MASGKKSAHVLQKKFQFGRCHVREIIEMDNLTHLHKNREMLCVFFQSTEPVKTPYRTPKGVCRVDPEVAEKQRILGTPDYLSPELLLQQEHGLCQE